MAVNEDKRLSDYEKKTLRELQQSSNTAYVPAFTETENYKFDSKELNGQVLQAGTNVTIDNNNVIRSTDTKLKSSDNINITSDNKLVYTGPRGEGTDLVSDSDNIRIMSTDVAGRYKVNTNITYGNEVRDVHTLATEYNCTSTYFTSPDSGKSIKGHFAGFVNNCITFGREPYEDNVANSELNLVISEDISMQYWLGGSPDRWILATPDDVLSFKKVNGTYPPYASRIRGDYYTQLIFNTPNIAALTLHTWWLQHVTHRENVLIQVNKGQNMKTIYLFNGLGDENNGASFYFYHNGQTYKKENVSNGNFIIIGSVQSNGDLYTDLSGPNITNGRADDSLYSLPFTVNTGRSDWCICTVQRFYCIHEVDSNNKHKYYFIESMY